MILTGYSQSLLEASWMTIQLAFVSLAVGLVLAMLFAGGEMSRYRVIAWPTTFVVTILRGLPELLVVLFIFFVRAKLFFILLANSLRLALLIGRNCVIAYFCILCCSNYPWCIKSGTQRSTRSSKCTRY